MSPPSSRSSADVEVDEVSMEGELKTHFDQKMRIHADNASSESQFPADIRSSTERLGSQTILQPHLEEMEKRIMEKVDERLVEIQSRMNAKLDLILDHIKTKD